MKYYCFIYLVRCLAGAAALLTIQVIHHLGYGGAGQRDRGVRRENIIRTDGILI
jgi:hypothetical protein